MHIPTGETVSIFEAAERYKAEGQATIVLPGGPHAGGGALATATAKTRFFYVLFPHSCVPPPQVCFGSILYGGIRRC